MSGINLDKVVNSELPVQPGEEVSKNFQAQKTRQASVSSEQVSDTSIEQRTAQKPKLSAEEFQEYVHHLVDPFVQNRQFIKREAYDVHDEMAFLIAKIEDSENPLEMSEAQKFVFYQNALDYMFSHSQSHIRPVFLTLAVQINQKEDPLYETLKQQLNDYAVNVKQQARELGQKKLPELLALGNPVKSFRDLQKAIPVQEQYRLVLDGKQQADLAKTTQGWKGYERRETGCVQAMLNGLKYALEHVEGRVTLDLLHNVHALIRANVGSMLGRAGHWRDGIPMYEVTFYSRDLSHEELDFIDSGLISIAGYLDHLGASKESFKDLHTSVLGQTLQSNPYAYYIYKVQTMGATDESISSTIGRILELYEERMKQTDFQDHAARLGHIVELVCMLNTEHPFQDGNGRVFDIILLNKELIRHGYMPVILWNPNVLSVVSKEEGILELIQGMHIFHHLVTTGNFIKDVTEEGFEGETCPFHFDADPSVLKDYFASPDYKEILSIDGEIERDKLKVRLLSESPIENKISAIKAASAWESKTVKEVILNGHSGSPIALDLVNIALEKLPALQKLEASYISVVRMSQLIFSSKLDTFTSQNSRLNGLGMVDLFKAFPNLKKLDLSYLFNNGAQRGIGLFSNIFHPSTKENFELPEMPHLEEVILEGVKSLTLEDIRVLLQKAPNLRVLNLKDTGLKAEELQVAHRTGLEVIL